MTDMRDTGIGPTLADLLDLHKKNIQAGINTCLPGEIVSYDAATQRADVKIMLKRVLRNAAGDRVTEELPILPLCPVAFYRCGAFAITMPLEAGDAVQVFFGQWAIDRWFYSGEVSDPGDLRHHSLASAWCVPGLFAHPDRMNDAHSSQMMLGAIGGAQIHFTSNQVRLGAAGATERNVKGDANKTAFDNFRTAFSAWIELVRLGIVAGGGTLDNTAITTAISTLGTEMGNALSSTVRTS